MRARFVFVFSILVAGVVSACGGGGGGGGGNPPTSKPTNTPTVQPTVAANPDGCVGVNATTRSNGAHTAAAGIQPPANGASATYSGTLSQTIVQVSPCPVGTATANAGVNIAVNMTSATSETDVETDSYGRSSTQVTTVATVTSSPDPSTNSLAYTESKEQSTDYSGDVLTTTYGGSGLAPLVYAIASPFSATPLGTIVNDPPSEVKDVLADLSSTDRTYTSVSGAYSESDTAAGISGTNTITVNADASAQYVIQTPLFAGSPNFVNSITLSYSKPVGGIITLNASFTGGATPPPSVQIEQWWPSSATSLYSDTTDDVGSKTLPTQCGPSGYTSGEDFQRTITNIDPALGSYDVRTIDTYVVKSGSTVEGPVCVNISDVEELFYDYLFNTPYFFYVSQEAAPFQTNTIQESYWLTSSAGALTHVRSDAASMSQIPGLAASVAARNAGLNFMRETERSQRIERFVKSLRAATNVKGVTIK